MILPLHCCLTCSAHGMVLARKLVTTCFSSSCFSTPIPCHLLSHNFQGHSISHQHTAFLFPWLHCLYHVLLGRPLEILQSLVYGFKAFCGTGVLQGLLQLCCVESFCTLSGKNQVFFAISLLYLCNLYPLQ